MNLKPKAIYYKVKLTLLQSEQVLVAYNGKTEWLRLDDKLEVPEFYLTEKQFTTQYDKLIQIHMSVALRKYVENYILGHEKFETDEEGNIIEETWEWIKGYIEPSNFMMMTVPYYVKKIDYIETDEDGLPYKKA